MGVGGVLGSLGGISFDITAIDSTGAGVDSAVQNLQRLETQSKSTTAQLRQIAIAFGSLTAISATAVVASDRVITLERSTGRAAITLGQTTRAMFEYVQELSNATDSQEEVGATMDYLSRAGIKWGEELTNVYKDMDLLGDAIGQTSTTIAQELIPTFKGLGLEISDISKYIDLLAYASRTTLFDVSTWSFILRRNGEAFIEYGVKIEDTIAIIAKMNDIGIPQKKIMTLINEALKDMGGNLKDVKEGEKELLEIQEKLNDSQKSASDITRMYRYDMQMAGGDIKERVRLSNAYNRAKYENQGETQGLVQQRTAVEQKIETAKSAKTPSLVESLGKADVRLGGDVLPNAIAEAEANSPGKAKDYATIADMYTGTEKATHDMDVALQNTLGKNVGADTAASMVYLRNISGIITTVASVLAIIQGFSATTAIATSATAIKGGASAEALAGAAGIGTFAGLAAVLVGGIAGTIIAADQAQKATIAVGRMQQEETKQEFLAKGGTEEEWIENYVEPSEARRKKLTTLGENAPAPEDMIGTDLAEVPLPVPKNPYTPEQIKANEAKKPRMTTDEYANTEQAQVEMYAEGGVVPGPIGEPRPAIVHGGETIIPVGEKAYNWTESKASKEKYEEKRIEALPGTVLANLIRDSLDIIGGMLESTSDEDAPEDRGGMFNIGFGNYDKGGVVPGPIGEPQPAIVHGGETVIPYRSPLPGVENFGNYGDAGKDMPKMIADAISDALSGMSGLSVTIQNMTLSKDYPFQKMMSDIQATAKSQRVARGIRSV